MPSDEWKEKQRISGLVAQLEYLCKLRNTECKADEYDESIEKLIADVEAQLAAVPPHLRKQNMGAMLPYRMAFSPRGSRLLDIWVKVLLLCIRVARRFFYRPR
jgi:hypothetical protein